mmetsp:Transcript_17430/g.50789  ORF Transcript_17430/g.50789 Transcript_17430/m.50789 type:complete len:242 (+) Transcript_17430:1239-1964(+)
MGQSLDQFSHLLIFPIIQYGSGHIHILRRGNLQIGVLPQSQLDGLPHRLHDRHVVRHLQPLLGHLLKPPLQRLDLDHLRRVDLPQPRPRNRPEDERPVLRFLDGGLARHAEDRRAVLLGVRHDVAHLPDRDERTGAVVHGHVRARVPGELGQLGQAVLHGTLPLLPGVSEGEPSAVFVHDGLVLRLIFRVHHQDDHGRPAAMPNGRFVSKVMVRFCRGGIICNRVICNFANPNRINASLDT